MGAMANFKEKRKLKLEDFDKKESAFLKSYNLSNASFSKIDRGYQIETALYVLNQHKLTRHFYNFLVLEKSPVFMASRVGHGG